MSNGNKIRLKEMSHKKLRKLCKGLGRQCADYSKENGMLLNSEAKKAEQIGELKKYARSLEQTLASEARRIKDKDKRIADLEHALDAMGNGPDSNWTNDQDIAGSLKQLNQKTARNVGIDPGGKSYDATYIGEMPSNLNMGVDGQLRSFNEMTDVEFATFVAEDVRRAMVEDEPDKVEDDEAIKRTTQRNKFGSDVLNVGNMSETMTEQEKQAAEWAIRNGHHQPEGTPEPNRMESVRVKSADEISAENKQKHVDMVCNEIQQDASRILNATEYISPGMTDKT